ncbi:hypothetical protein F5H01DRAFT_145150 [Linnemannia elongata]|nr:hypothetical protein F5H01DRAFT_145150 [Linnemannia elongata]
MYALMEEESASPRLTLSPPAITATALLESVSPWTLFSTQLLRAITLRSRSASKGYPFQVKPCTHPSFLTFISAFICLHCVPFFLLLVINSKATRWPTKACMRSFVFFSRVNIVVVHAIGWQTCGIHDYRGCLGSRHQGGACGQGSRLEPHCCPGDV